MSVARRDDGGSRRGIAISMQPMLILASRSPRRARLLREAGYVFVQADPPFADPPQPASSHPEPEHLAAVLAASKAISLVEAGVFREHPGGVILSADTVCVSHDGRCLGQPVDRDDAKQMIKSFMERSHRVVTGVAMMSEHDAQPEIFADTAHVWMASMPDEQLETYLDTQQWIGKAGGYNLFDRQRAGWNIRVDGDPATVVGLPMRALASRLEKRGVRPTMMPTP